MPPEANDMTARVHDACQQLRTQFADGAGFPLTEAGRAVVRAALQQILPGEGRASSDRGKA